MKRFRIHWLLLTNFFTLLVVLGFACSWYEFDEGEVSLFTPEVIKETQYRPFFRSNFYMFYRNEAEASLTNFSAINIAEWKTYFSNVVKDEVLNYWLYRSDLSMINYLNGKGKKPANADSVLKFYNLKDIISSTKLAAFYQYLLLARQNEGFATRDIYNYYGDTLIKQANGFYIDNQLKQTLLAYNSCKESFIKERYLFQVIRLHYFNHEYQQAIDLYNRNQGQFLSDGSMKWRSIGYLAASYVKLKKYKEANYWYSLLFADYEPMRNSAYWSFHPQEEADWNGCLALCKSEEEKVKVWSLFGVCYDAVRAIKEIYKVNPKAEILDLLLTRAINIEEEHFTGGLIENYSGYSESDGELDDSLLWMVKKIAVERKINSVPVWCMGAAYLSYAHHQFQEGDKLMAMVPSVAETDSILFAQFHLIRLFGDLKRIDKLEPKEEARILSDVRILFDDKTKNLKNFRSTFAKNWVRYTLSNLYKQAGDWNKAEVIRSGAILYKDLTINSLNEFLRYLGNTKTHGDLERFFIEQMEQSPWEYKQLLGIRYAQTANFDSALVIMKQVNPGGVLLADPFVIHNNDCHDCDHGDLTQKKYSCVEFLEEMARLKDNLINDRGQRAQQYFKLANGMYNISYYGNARTFYETSLLNIDDYYFNYGSNPIDQLPEFSNQYALENYSKAFDYSNDKEFKAKCLFMMTKCKRNLDYTFKRLPKDADFVCYPQFSLLKEQYNGTAYYKEILKECKYFSNCVGAN